MENSESNNNIKDKEQRILENEKLRLTQKAAQFRCLERFFNYVVNWIWSLPRYRIDKGMSQRYGTGYFILFLLLWGLYWKRLNNLGGN